MHLNIYRVQSC